MAFKILTVAENDGDSESMTAIQTQHSWRPGTPPGSDVLRFNIDIKRNINIQVLRDGLLQTKIQFNDLHLKEFIEFLTDMQVFISEEETIAKLRGNK